MSGMIAVARISQKINKYKALRVYELKLFNFSQFFYELKEYI